MTKLIKKISANEANEVLSDPEKRKKYDTYGEHWQHGEEYRKSSSTTVSRVEVWGWIRRVCGGASYSYSGDDGEFSIRIPYSKQRRVRTGKSHGFKGRNYTIELHLSKDAGNPQTNISRKW